jgi:putative flippase GtrA
MREHVSKHRVVRFAFAGLINTTVNFIVLNIVFYVSNHNKIVSSVIATSCAILVSFVLNQSFVFRDNTEPYKKFVKFTALTALGVLLIQTTIYSVCIVWFRHYFSSNFVVINLSNVIASLSVMFWNYNSYKFIVFKSKKATHESSEIETA